MKLEDGFLVPHQSSVSKSSSQLSRLSSFNINKIMYESRPEYTRAEAKASPELMKNILDSLPNLPETEKRTNSIPELMTGDVPLTRKQFRMDLRQTLGVLEKVTKQLNKAMVHAMPIPKLVVALPHQASKSKVDKLPPITNTHRPVNMTTAPVDWSNKKSSPKSKTTTSAQQSVSKEVEQLIPVIDEKIMRKFRIAELERAKQEELKKLQELEQEAEDEAKTKIAEEVEAEKARKAELEKEAKLAEEKKAKMAEYDRIITESIQARITEVEEAKKKMEEDRLAELEKAKEIAKKEAEMQAEMEKAEALKKERMAEYDRIIDAGTQASIAAVEKAKRHMEEERLAQMSEADREKELARLAELGVAMDVEKQPQSEDEKAKALKEERMAEYDRIIEASTQASIAAVEKAKRHLEEERLAQMSEADREKELARLAELGVSLEFEKEPKTEAVQDDEKEARLAELEEVKKEKEETSLAEPKKEEKQMEVAEMQTEDGKAKALREERMAEYDRIIEASTQASIAAVEKAKRRLEKERLAQMSEADREKELARLAELGVDMELLNNEESQDEELDELAQSYVQPKMSRPRPPTPPAQHPPMHQSQTSFFGSQMSLRTINETATSDFTPEFASPLTTHSHHAVVPYLSLRTRFGLHIHETMSDRQLGEEMKKLSQATMLVHNEMLKRNQSKELSNGKETTDSIAAIQNIDGKPKKVATAKEWCNDSLIIHNLALPLSQMLTVTLPKTADPENTEEPESMAEVTEEEVDNLPEAEAEDKPTEVIKTS